MTSLLVIDKGDFKGEVDDLGSSRTLLSRGGHRTTEYDGSRLTFVNQPAVGQVVCYVVKL